LSNYIGNTKAEISPYSEFCEIYLLYNDEINGPVTFFTYPDILLKKDPEKLRLLNIHYIWRVSMKEQALMDYIDLGYKDKIFFARKFITISKRKKHEKGPEYDNFDTIVIILALPNQLNLFGGDLLINLTKNIISNFEGKLFKIFQAEIAKDQIIKSPRIKEMIKHGDTIQQELKNLINITCNDYFNSTLKKIDTKSIKRQKAIAFFALKGIDAAQLGIKDNRFLSSDSSKISNEETITYKSPLSISSVNIAENDREVKILIENKTKENLNNISLKISHLKDFFEIEIMNQSIDQWFPYEQLIFSFPIISKINKYLLIISQNNELWLSKKIDLKFL
jgi:hypothetical protein